MYIFKQLFNIDISKIKDVIVKVSKKTGHNKLFIFFDMFFCIIFFKAGYTDYLFFEMYDLSYSERKTILTRGKNNDYIKKLNPKKYWKYIDDKILFNQKFRKYINRDYIVLNKNNFLLFNSFFKNKKELIVKPINSTCGVGVEKIKYNDQEISKVFNKLLDNSQILIEEVAKQHIDMKKLHNNSINTIRLVTIHNKYDITTVVAAVCRIGTNGRVVDNFHNGGICAPIDIKTGIINDRGVDKEGNYYDVHPTSKTKINGFKIPNWKEVIKLVISASNEIKELGIIGWDVCIGPTKPSLIEANQYPAYDLYKLIKIDDSKGIIPVFEHALNKTK